MAVEFFTQTIRKELKSITFYIDRMLGEHGGCVLVLEEPTQAYAISLMLKKRHEVVVGGADRDRMLLNIGEYNQGRVDILVISTCGWLLLETALTRKGGVLLSRQKELTQEERGRRERLLKGEGRLRHVHLIPY